MARVLVVEDDEQVRVLAEGLVRELGHETLTAGNLKEATALLADAAREIDLLFVDLNLGDEPQSGLAVAKFARRERPNVPVLYTTGTGVNDGTLALFVDPHVFLAKPYTLEHLRVAIQNTLAAWGT